MFDEDGLSCQDCFVPWVWPLSDFSRCIEHLQIIYKLRLNRWRWQAVGRSLTRASGVGSKGVLFNGFRTIICSRNFWKNPEGCQTPFSQVFATVWLAHCSPHRLQTNGHWQISGWVLNAYHIMTYQYDDKYSLEIRMGQCDNMTFWLALQWWV